MRICRPGKFELDIGLGIVAAQLTMNIIRRYKERRRLAKLIEEHRANMYVCRIPANCKSQESRVAGISALPAEIWGIIIDYMVIEQLGSPYMQCSSLYKILQYRMVCRTYISTRAEASI